LIVREKNAAVAGYMLKYYKQLISFIKSPKEPAAIIGVALYTIFIMFLVSVVSAGNMVWGVFSGGQLISVVSDPAEAGAVITQMADEYSDGNVIALMGAVQVKKIRYDGSDMKESDLRAALHNAVGSRVRGTEVVVNGTPILAMSSRAEADNLLKFLRAAYSVPEGQTVFLEDIRLNDTMVEKIQVVSLESALDAVKNGAKKQAVYQVKNGDTLWDIARSSGISADKILASNPGMDPDRLRLGDVLKMEKAEPLINVETVLTKVATEQVIAPVEEKKDSSLLTGERRVLAQGKNGKKEVTYQIINRNGSEFDRKVINEVTLEEAQPKVIATGTRVLLASRSGGGRLGWPAAGSISSPFGPRGGGTHSGIDISSYTGATVAAAESGTVVMAQWYSGYGKCVDISHGEGVVTRYAHLSSIGVNVGQKVDRGELIGNVGTTGYATGPHLHFEVIISGQARNPLNYL